MSKLAREFEVFNDPVDAECSQVAGKAVVAQKLGVATLQQRHRGFRGGEGENLAARTRTRLGGSRLPERAIAA